MQCIKQIIQLNDMAEKNCENLDYSTEDLKNSESIPVGTLESRVDDLSSIMHPEPDIICESLTSPKIIVEDTEEIAVQHSLVSDNHLINNDNTKLPKVTKKSNKIHNLVHFFERKHSPKNTCIGNICKKAKHEKQQTVKGKAAPSAPTVEEEYLTSKTVSNNKSMIRQDKVEVMDNSEQDKRRPASWFRRHKAASDDLHLSMLVDEINQPNSQVEAEHMNLPLNVEFSNEPSEEHSEAITPILKVNRANKTGSRYKRNFQALEKMKAAFISGESDEKEEALDLFQSNNPDIISEDNSNDSIHSDQAPHEPSDGLTPDVVGEKEDASEIVEGEDQNPPNEAVKEKWQKVCKATLTKKHNRKHMCKEELKARDDKIKELLDILTKHVQSIIEVREENEIMKRELENLELINSKQYELIFHLSKANIDHYQPKIMASDVEKTKQFSKRISKSLDINRKYEMPDLIPGTEKAMSEDY